MHISLIVDTVKLEQLGLTNQQAKIYLKLLELGPSSVGLLIKNLDIARISCYDTLNRLMSKGLVSYVQERGNRKYGAVDPDKLIDIAKEQEQKSKKNLEVTESLVKDLKKIKIEKYQSNDATIYKTKEGIKSLFELMINTNKTIYTISATGKALYELKYFFPQWHIKRKKLHLKTYIIFNEDTRNKKITEIPLAEIRFMPKDSNSPSTVFVFGDCVATLLWSDVPTAFLIKSKEISETYMNYFKIIWSKAKK